MRRSGQAAYKSNAQTDKPICKAGFSQSNIQCEETCCLSWQLACMQTYMSLMCLGQAFAKTCLCNAEELSLTLSALPSSIQSGGLRVLQ